jgi:choline dehydrogenase-like flavoprotein
MDHPPTLIPFFMPVMFGAQLPTRSFPVQLAAALEHMGKRDMISFYYPGALLWSNLLAEMPFPMQSSLKMLKNLLGGMLVAQIWETSLPSPRNYLHLDDENNVRIHYPDRPPYAHLRRLLTALRPLGAFSMKRLASMSPPGWGFHYAGTLPMRTRPGEHETHVDGKLWNSKRVRVIDGSVLPSLPAKNHSFTVMANAARIADEALKCGY